MGEEMGKDGISGSQSSWDTHAQLLHWGGTHYFSLVMIYEKKNKTAFGTTNL